jgi:hypothetical protein
MVADNVNGVQGLGGPLIDRTAVDVIDQRAQLELTRFRGHPSICVRGVHHVEDETNLRR